MRIKKVREIRGYSQNYMATKLKISQEQYSYLENRQKKITEDCLNLIASVLGISVEQLRSFDPEEWLADDRAPISGGYISKLVIKSHENEIEAYKELIKNLRNEIEQLKKRIGG